MPPTLFTPSSARRVLARIRPVVESMCRTYRRLEQRGPGSVACDRRVDPEYFRLLVDLTVALERIGAAGAQVRNPRDGLIDFPARRGGRDVLLCWRAGEPTLAWWHGPDEGYAGRRRVDEEGPWEAGLAEESTG